MPYYLILAYLVMCFSYQKYAHFEKKILDSVFNFKTGFFVIFLFAALRGNGNGDYATYIHGVGLIDSLSMVFKPVNVHFEFGFRLISYISNALNLHPQFVIIVMNAISIGSVFYFVNRYSKQKELSSLLFFPIMMLFDMHHSRSAVGISLGLIIFDMLIRKKVLFSIIPLLVAISFHKSSVILLLLYPLILLKSFDHTQMKLSTKPKLKIFVIIVFALIFYFFNPADIILYLFNNKLLMPLYIKLNSYIANGKWSYPFSLLDPRFLILVLTYLLASFSMTYKKKVNNLFMYMLSISILIILCLSFSTVLVIRAYNFFNIFIIVFIPNLLGDLSVKKLKSNLNIKNKKLNHFLNTKGQLMLTSVYFLILFGYFVYTIAITTKQFEYFTIFRGIL